MKSNTFKPIIISIVLVVILLGSALAQGNRKYFVSPGISAGYTLGAKMNFGFTLDAGIAPKSENNFRYGVSFSYYIVGYKNMMHKQKSLNLMVQNDLMDIKLGFGRMRNGWGYEKRNHCIVFGYNADFSLKYPNNFSPVIGYKTFIYKQRHWAWFEGPYRSFYAGYEYYNPPKNNNISFIK